MRTYQAGRHNKISNTPLPTSVSNAVTVSEGVPELPVSSAQLQNAFANTPLSFVAGVIDAGKKAEILYVAAVLIGSGNATDLPAHSCAKIVVSVDGDVVFTGYSCDSPVLIKIPADVADRDIEVAVTAHNVGLSTYDLGASITYRQIT